jgi:hypothetical protein
MKPNYIQTLHPQSGKVNHLIAQDKYNFIKETLLEIISQAELTHTELMEELYARVKDDFQGGVQWYGAAVKLDLEARGIIQRSKKKPEKYSLKHSNS